jgi:hypothetical protein
MVHVISWRRSSRVHSLAQECIMSPVLQKEPLQEIISYFSSNKKHTRICLYDVPFALSRDMASDHRAGREHLGVIHENIFQEVCARKQQRGLRNGLRNTK